MNRHRLNAPDLDRTKIQDRSLSLVPVVPVAHSPTVSETQLTGSGDNSVRFYYNEDFVAPYDLLEAQKYKLDPQHLDSVTPTQNHEYPWLSQRQATAADVQGADFTRLYVMFHSIYARKGLIYYNRFLSRVFEQQPWYRPLYRVYQFKREVQPKLSSVEQANLKFLRDRFLSQAPQ